MVLVVALFLRTQQIKQIINFFNRNRRCCVDQFKFLFLFLFLLLANE